LDNQLAEYKDGLMVISAIVYIFFLYFAWMWLGKNEVKHPSDEEEKRESENQSHQKSYSPKDLVDETEKKYARILELKGRVTPHEIKTNYHRLVSLYHPDKVNHLGPDLIRLAEEKTKDITEAYRYFRDKYKIV